MATYKTKGIIIKRRNFGEADKLIIVFCDREGKIKAKAKGVRRILSKNGGSIELFTLSDFIFAEGKIFDVLVSATIIDSYKNLKRDLKKTAIAYYFSELVDKLTLEKEGNSNIFNLLNNAFSILNEFSISSLSYFSIISYFELNLLSLLGYAPQLGRCVHCHNKIEPKINYFSSQLGGMLCCNCQKNDKNALEISKNCIKILKIILKYDLKILVKIKIEKNIQQEVKCVADNFLKYIAEKEFKSPKFIKEIDELSQVV